MTTYKITIKDNSIPEHMQTHNFHNEYTAIFKDTNPVYLFENIAEYIESMATELDTDPESLEILSIIKQ